MLHFAHLNCFLVVFHKIYSKSPPNLPQSIHISLPVCKPISAMPDSWRDPCLAKIWVTSTFCFVYLVNEAESDKYLTKMSREVEAYAFEPEYSEGEGNSEDDVDLVSENDSVAPNEDDERLANTDWCTCGLCITMPSFIECCCCLESDRVRNKFEELIACHKVTNSNSCITTVERFQTLCLDRDVLEISLIMIHNALRKGPVPNPIPNRWVDQFTVWNYSLQVKTTHFQYCLAFVFIKQLLDLFLNFYLSNSTELTNDNRRLWNAKVENNTDVWLSIIFWTPINNFGYPDCNFGYP